MVAREEKLEYLTLSFLPLAGSGQGRSVQQVKVERTQKVTMGHCL